MIFCVKQAFSAALDFRVLFLSSRNLAISGWAIRPKLRVRGQDGQFRARPVEAFSSAPVRPPTSPRLVVGFIYGQDAIYSVYAANQIQLLFCYPCNP